jgi:subtilisin family serine protease
MKRRVILILLLFFISNVIVSIYAQEKTANFYYAYNEKIQLTPVKSKLILRYSAIKEKVTSRIQSFSRSVVPQSVDTKTVIVNMIDETERNNLVAKLKNDSDLYSCQPIYTINTGLELGVTDEILVKFLDNVAQTQIEAINNLYKVTVIKKTEIYHLLKVPRGANALEIANKYFESGLVKFSHPNFISEAKCNYIPNDPYFAFQVALHNTGQLFNDNHTGTSGADIKAPEAWDLTKGNGNIVVAVIDQGVTSNHPDLPNSRQVRLNGSNFGSGNANDPSPVGNDNHGNSCAGVIAATQDNNEGITGIAPYCKIMPIRWDASTSVQGMCDAIKFATDNGADIISNSWGFNSDNPNLYPVIVAGIQYAVTKGRSGKGCVVLFAAGNTANHVDGNNGTIQFPGNVNVSGVITVGASDRYDQQAQYSPSSNMGSNNNQIIDIVAPSHRAYPCQIAGETFEMWSLDIPGDAGYNSWHDSGNCVNPPTVGEILPSTGVNFNSYTGRFGGTSHSCPVVAGVAALVLSVNSNFSQQNVFDILTSNTDKIGGYTYTNGQSNETGYGRVNAYKAVIEAYKRSLYISGPSQICDQATYTINNLPAGATVVWSATPSGVVSLQPSGSSVALTKVSGGSVALSATINNSVTVTKSSIQVGTVVPPFYLYRGLYGVSSGVVGKNYTFKAYGANASTNDLDYYWTVTTPDVEDEFPLEFGGREFDFMASTPGNYTVTLSCNGGCGWSDPVTKTFYFQESMGFALSPNPASKSTTISMISSANANTATLLSASASSSVSTSCSVSVLDAYGSVVYTGKKNGNQFTIPTASLRNGVYSVIVSDGTNTYQNKLIVKH